MNGKVHTGPKIEGFVTGDRGLGQELPPDRARMTAEIATCEARQAQSLIPNS